MTDEHRLVEAMTDALAHAKTGETEGRVSAVSMLEQAYAEIKELKKQLQDAEYEIANLQYECLIAGEEYNDGC